MTFRFPLTNTSWDQCELDAIDSVKNSGHFTMGDKVAKFEETFSNYFGSKYAVMANSGSSANLLMIACLFFTKNESLVLKPGDEIIVPAVGWSTTYFPLQQYNLKLKFVDIDLQTLNFDLDQLKKAVSNKTRAILAVNLLGNPNDFNRIREIIGTQNILLLEDNCESMGAKFQSKYCGTFGILGSFSTFYSHHISTMEGGVVVTDNEELYQLMLSLRAHGWTRNLPKENLVCDILEKDKFSRDLVFEFPGYNLRPLEMSGAIGLEQLKKLPWLVNERKKNGLQFQSKLVANEKFFIQEEIGESSWFGFSLIVKNSGSLSREHLLDALSTLGFETRPIVTGNFTKNNVMKYLNYEIFGELTNAEYLDQNGLLIGNHHKDMSEAIDLLAKL